MRSECGSTSRMTTEPAPISANSPTVTPQRIVEFAPIVAPLFITVGRKVVGLRLIKARGLNSFVKTTYGPTKTSSSRVTQSQRATPFLIVQPLPTVTLFSMKTCSPILQWLPIRAPSITWLKPQIRVPIPTWRLSQTPRGWTKNSIPRN
jgi:hypothetical protein